jgi:hypothetical protein
LLICGLCKTLHMITNPRNAFSQKRWIQRRGMSGINPPSGSELPLVLRQSIDKATCGRNPGIFPNLAAFANDPFRLKSTCGSFLSVLATERLKIVPVLVTSPEKLPMISSVIKCILRLLFVRPFRFVHGLLTLLNCVSPVPLDVAGKLLNK